MRRSSLAIVSLWLVACHADVAPNPQVGTTPPTGSALPPVEPPVATTKPKAPDLPRDRSVSTPAIRDAHAHAQEVVLGSAALPLELPPAGADVHGRYTPLFEPEGSDPLASFYAALDGLKAGKTDKVRVMVYGASGTAADRWTAYLRAYLQARFGDGGPGFVPLGKATKWSRHNEYTLASSKQWIKHSRGKSASEGAHYGLLGAALAAKKKGASCSIAPAKSSASSRAVASFELWYLQQPGGGKAEVTLDGKVAATIDTRADKAGAGYLKVPCDAGGRTLGLRTLDDAEVRTFGVVAETATPGVVVDTLGIVGQHASWMLDWDPALWAEHMVRRDPALVVFAFGTNEAYDKRFDESRFVTQYGEALARIRSTLPKASCVLMAPGDQGKPGDELSPVHDANLAIVRRIERELASKHGCALWDAQAFMNNPGGMDAWVKADPPLAKDDYVHTTSRGASMIAMAVADAIMWSYDATRVDASAVASGR
ncbi:MAG TPA: GDSL-type esterase/lipase family protein [Nannocystaceae bacterium]|nr:GDSL-type esterase/lipase family protein [Nannocystaceae bacterium]